MRTLGLLPLCAFFIPGAFAQSTCGNVQLQVTPDFGFAVGSSSGGSAYTFTLGGQALASGPMTQLALFHYENSLASTSGIAPTAFSGAAYDNGKFGKGVYLQAGAGIAYPGAMFNVSEGTVEMWIAPRFNGNDPAFSTPNQSIFTYNSANGDSFVIAEDSAHQGRIIYTGATVNGQWESAYSGRGDITGWKAGEWHHIAVTFSASANHIRFYLDGVIIADSNEGHFYPPSATRGSILLGSAAFTIDEVRVSNIEQPAKVIQYDADRSSPFLDNEIYLPLVGVSAGQLTYSVGTCGTASVAYNGSVGIDAAPIMNPNPPSTLLPPGATSVTLTVQTPSTTSCGYSANIQAQYSAMKPFDQGQGATTHSATIQGLISDPSQLNTVYVRCASAPGYLLQLQYRAMPNWQSAPFPRISDIGAGTVFQKGASYLSRYALLTDSGNVTPAVLSQIHNANPKTLILFWVNSVEDFTGTLPESYYLHDVNGNRIRDWPTAYLLNMTNPAVGDYQANLFHSDIVNSGLVFDGCFFDSFYFGEPNSFTNYLGQAIAVDADGDGKQDNQDALNQAWRSGMLHMMQSWRKLLPNAIAVAHLIQDPTPDVAAVLSGDSILFLPTDVQEGRFPFAGLLQMYNDWWAMRGTSAAAIVESTPQNQISYGYGAYADWALLPKNIPPAVLSFAQSFYPSMRFPLAISLMNDGFFNRDLGDQSMGNTNWWYDEYDFSLGLPVSPQMRIVQSQAANILQNGGFENGMTGWQLGVFNDGQGKANVTTDIAMAAAGNSSAHIQIASAGTANWHIYLEQDDISLTAATSYQVQFWARTNSPRTITVFSQGGPTNVINLSTQINLGTTWSLYSLQFTAPASVSDARFQFWVGDVTGDVWIDDVQLTPATADVYRRDFTSGVVLLNGTASQQTIALEPGLQRFNGTQAPRFQYIVDDSSARFTSDTSWRTQTLDSGFRIDDNPLYIGAKPPFYHCWQSTCHQQDAPGGDAQWNLNIPEDGQYTIQVWLPAAPNAGNWTTNAVYEVVSNGNVIVSATLDQTTAAAADGWHMIASKLNLTAADAPLLRVRNGGAGALIADAVYVTSAALYNDGSAARQVTLAPYDGILLQRQTALPLAASRVNSVVNAASYQPAIASGGFVSIVGTGFTNSSRSWTSSDFSGNNLPVSLDGVSVTINGQPAYVEYISPTQINAIAPDDDTIGQVGVQVTTPQGVSYAGTVLKQKLSPAFFTYQAGATSYVAAIHLDGTLVGPMAPSSRPVVPGEVIEIYGTGFGLTNPSAPTAELLSQPAPLSLPATVTIGGVNAQVQWAGIVSSGLYQLNVQIPNVATGNQPVQASISGFQSVANVFIAVAQQ